MCHPLVLQPEHCNCSNTQGGKAIRIIWHSMLQPVGRYPPCRPPTWISSSAVRPRGEEEGPHSAPPPRRVAIAAVAAAATLGDTALGLTVRGPGARGELSCGWCCREPKAPANAPSDGAWAWAGAAPLCCAGEELLPGSSSCLPLPVLCCSCAAPAAARAPAAAWPPAAAWRGPAPARSGGGCISEWALLTWPNAGFWRTWNAVGLWLCSRGGPAAIIIGDPGSGGWFSRHLRLADLRIDFWERAAAASAEYGTATRLVQGAVRIGIRVAVVPYPFTGMHVALRAACRP